MKTRMSVSSGQGVRQALRDLQQRLDSRKEAAVGLPSTTGTHPTAGMSYARLGAIHEFGGTFMHPGGTPYMSTPEGTRFLGKEYANSGFRLTKPHQIAIPERSFLRVPLRAKQDEIAASFRKLVALVVKEEMTMTQALNAIGAKGASISQEAISAGISPPNAPETVKRKGSSTPLVNDGHLRQAITWVVRDKE